MTRGASARSIPAASSRHFRGVLLSSSCFHPLFFDARFPLSASALSSRLGLVAHKTPSASGASTASIPAASRLQIEGRVTYFTTQRVLCSWSGSYLIDLYLSEGMDKSWMENWRSKLSNKEYKEGIKSFMQKAQVVVGLGNKIRCPCHFCTNKEFIQIGLVEEHLFVNEMLPSYACWVFHEESYTLEEVIRQRRPQRVETDNNRIHELLHDVKVEQIVGHDNVEEFGGTEGEPEQDTVGGEQFNKLFADANRELFPGCQSFSKLKFFIRLLHIKTTRNLSNKTMDDLIGLMKEALPTGETLPRNYYEAKMLLRKLGFFYEKIDACKNDFILFWKQHEKDEKFPQCHEPRYVYSSTKDKPIPHKVLRHFPLKPRLRRLFSSKENARDMRWDAEVRVGEPNVLRHSADSE
ncbi:hypothetical protein H6P81_003217 [Aristolochia fimbriata]|uniref:Transposase-associated domain-containing protein n=1 Tax=Aristolochia fimbriata TaxID=158543 RepID=A0AAV7FDT5_ARIFI|nr:hypothetical protein H6P81_003217 [Aristolochia fimbriata]